ncbi:MAG: glycoside hydrolase family protein [Lentisphaeria bacterium]|nr:glycoside hydrolase family protein [Lentisphaeria bacterium]
MPHILSEQAHEEARRQLMRNEGLVRMLHDSASGQWHYSADACAEAGNARYPVYDDKDAKRIWLPDGTMSYEKWAKTLQGKPTLGYGMRYDLLSPELRQEYIDAKGAVSMEWILAGLDSHIDTIMAQVIKRHPKIAEMNPQQQGALASFFYNLGPSPANKETLEAALAANDIAKIHSALALHNKMGGKIPQGLVAQRERERAPFGKEAVVSQDNAHDTYTIQAGDTLWKLWKSNAKPNESWEAFAARIKSANPMVNPDNLKVGAKINLV